MSQNWSIHARSGTITPRYVPLLQAALIEAVNKIEQLEPQIPPELLCDYYNLVSAVSNAAIYADIELMDPACQTTSIPMHLLQRINP